MNAFDDTYVDQLDAPPRAYFEIPHEWTHGGGAVSNGFTRCRLRIFIHNFRVTGAQQPDVNAKVDQIVSAITAFLHEAGGGIIWWRRRPEYGFDHGTKLFKASLRMGTSPGLPKAFWEDLGEKVGNHIGLGELMHVENQVVVAT